MGRFFAEQLASGELVSDRKQQIAIHLQSNCYPPVSLSMVDVCDEAISYFNQGFLNELCSLPDGVLYQGSETVRAYKVVETFRLDAWIDEEIEQHD
jgi:hypothetical protein